MQWTDDPVRDADRYWSEKDAESEKLPKCCCCDNPINEDFYFDINGEFYCSDCLNYEFRKEIESYAG